MECSKTAVAALMRVAWRSIGPLLVRVTRRLLQGSDRLEGLGRIGIGPDLLSEGQRYLIVVVDHAAITHVSADAASWIANVVTARCPQAIQCVDPFHAVAWATQAIDEIRRELRKAARGAGHAGQARLLKGARWGLWKSAETLSARNNASWPGCSG